MPKSTRDVLAEKIQETKKLAREIKMLKEVLTEAETHNQHWMERCRKQEETIMALKDENTTLKEQKKRLKHEKYHGFVKKPSTEAKKKRNQKSNQRRKTKIKEAIALSVQLRSGAISGAEIQQPTSSSNCTFPN